jgi:UDP-glucuronate decarboxylase
MPTSLVTGGAGFLGSHLCEALLAGGTRVICLDSFLTSTRTGIAHLLGRDGFSVVEHDVTEPIPDPGPIARIYNLACPASPPHYQRDPIHTLLTSVLGTHNLLMLAERTGARFLQASTSEVYGDPEQHPQREEYWGHVNPNGVRSCYDEGKRAAEALSFDMLRAGRADVRVARIFNTYGPRMQAGDGRIVSNFVVQALRREPLTIYGSGTQTRSFCYVSDLVAGFVPGEITLVTRPLPKDDPQRRRPDISRAGALLGWAPKVPLREGLAETIAWFAEELGVPLASEPDRAGPSAIEPRVTAEVQP